MTVSVRPPKTAAALREAWCATAVRTRSFAAWAGVSDHAHPALFSESLSPSSRAARCYLLAEGGRIDLPLAPRLAEPIAIGSDRPDVEAACAALRECLDQIATNFVVVLKLDDGEGPHQLRNGFRRLRAVLSAFAPLLEDREVQRIGREVNWLDTHVGRLRDLDVLVDSVNAETPSQDAELARLAGDLHRKAARQRERLRDTMSGPRARAVLFAVAGIIDTLAASAVRGACNGSGRGGSVLEMCRAAIAAGWMELSDDARDVDELDAYGRHELRRKVRQLRYMVELFRPLFPAGRAEPFLSMLRDVQSAIGSLQDIALLSGVIQRYLRRRSGCRPRERLIEIVVRNDRLAASTLAEAKSAWRALLRAEAFWT